MEKAEKYAVPPILRFAAKQLICLGIGFLLARTRLFDGLPSFAIAFAAAAPQGLIFSAGIGAAIGSVVFAPDVLTGLTGAAAVLACGMIVKALQTITGTRQTPLTAFVVALLCCSTAGLTTLLAAGFYTGGVLLYLCDGIIAGGAAYFYMRALSLHAVLHRPAALDNTEVLAFTAGVSALLVSISSWSVYVFVPARVLAVGLVLMSAYLFGAAGGGAAGILCGAAMETACAQPGIACCYALSGLLGGLCARRGRFWLPVCVCVIAGLYPLLAQTNAAVAVFAEAALACALFCVMPQSVLLRLRRWFGSCAPSESMASSAQTRLRTASRAVAQITPALDERQLRGGKVPGTGRMTARVQSLVCTDCKHRPQCWQADRTEIADALAECFIHLRRTQTLSADALPSPLDAQCTRRNLLTAACVQAFEEQNRSSEALQDPFRTASDLLFDAAEQCGTEQREMPRESNAAQQVFRTYGIAVRTVRLCAYGRRMVLTARTEPFPDSVKKTALTTELGRACGCTFSLPTVTASGDAFLWRFVQTVQYRLRTGTAQHAADGRHCGDYYVTFAHEGRQIFLLCDGMGTGKAAALDAQAAAEIYVSLLKADLSFECAFRTLNTALLQREDAESVTTLDAVCVDLYTGDTAFYKAGAAASYVLHRKKADRVDMPGLPMGILPDAALLKTTRRLRRGDTVVLVSDGTCALRDDHLVRTLSAFQGGSAQQLAEQLLQSSRRASPRREDDSTVLVFVVE